MIDTILQAIQAKLATTVVELKTIDENWGQLDLFGNDIPVQWPCALLTLNAGQFSHLGTDVDKKPLNRQEGTLTFEISFAKLKLTNSSFKAPATQKIKAWEIWSIIEKSHAELHGWNPLPGSGKLMRTALSSTRRDDGVQEVKVMYTMGLHNC